MARDWGNQLSLVVLQVGMADRFWKLHSSQRYTVKVIYNNLIAIDVVGHEGFKHALWLKQVPLKVNIFIWRLFLNRLPTKMNLF